MVVKWLTQTDEATMEISAYEVDDRLIPALEKTLSEASDLAFANGRQLITAVHHGDFVLDPPEPGSVNVVVMNPPYLKLANTSAWRRAIEDAPGGIRVTNMYAAFDEAFRFRSLGMDTIYVFSDGLPNDGPGRPPANVTDETVITTALAKHLRAKLNNDWNKLQPGSPKVRINTIGFFYESPDVGAFLWALAREHDGNFVGMNKR